MCFENLLKFKCLIFLHKTIYTVPPTYLYATINFGRSARGLVLIQRKYKTDFSERQVFIYYTLEPINEDNSNTIETFALITS